MKKVILITNYFHFSSEKESNRYRRLAEMISSNPNLELEVITSKFYQRTQTFRSNLEELTNNLNYKVTFIDEIGYSKNISIRRLITSKIFALNVMKYLKSISNPDVIYQVVPTLDVAYLVSKYANQKNIKLIIDVQDLWPEAYKIAFNVPIISDILFLPFKIIANKIYKRADEIFAVSETYLNRVLKSSKKGVQGNSVYIGIDLSQFDKNAKENYVEKDEILKLAYCGSLDNSYDIKLVIDALSIVYNPPLFVVMGDGTLRKDFENYAKQKEVKTIFTGYLPYPKMCGLLCSCDIVINPIVKSSVASIINKHGDYAASGLPILNTQNSKEYMQLIEDYKMGFNSHSGDVTELVKNMQRLIDDKQLRQMMGKNARICAEEKFNREIIYKKIINSIINS